MKSLFLLLLLVSAARAAPVDPALSRLEAELTAAQEEFKAGKTVKERHDAFLADFRVRFESVVREVPPTSENAAARARILSLLGDRSGAVVVLQGAVEANPGDVGLRTILGQSQVDAKDYAGALATAEGILKADPTNQNALFLRQFSKDRVQSVAGSKSKAATSAVPSQETRPAGRPEIVFTPPKPRARTVVPGVAVVGEPGVESVSTIDLGALLPAYTLQNYSEKERAELIGAIDAARNATKRMHREHPNFVGDTTGSGKAANVTQTIDMFFGEAIRRRGFAFGPVNRSCINHREAVGAAVRAAIPEYGGLSVNSIMLGKQPWPEHHAVLVHPKDTNWVRSGVILDPWRNQSSSPSQFVYPYTTWKGLFPLQTMGGERMEEIKRVDP